MNLRAAYGLGHDRKQTLAQEEAIPSCDIKEEH